MQSILDPLFKWHILTRTLYLPGSHKPGRRLCRRDPSWCQCHQGCIPWQCRDGNAAVQAKGRETKGGVWLGVAAPYLILTSNGWVQWFASKGMVHDHESLNMGITNKKWIKLYSTLFLDGSWIFKETMGIIPIKEWGHMGLHVTSHGDWII